MAQTAKTKKGDVSDRSNKKECLYEILSSSTYLGDSSQKFEPIIWSRETQLKRVNKIYLEKNFPHGLNEDGELTLVGKVEARLSQSNRITDQIGQAKKSKSLEICFMNKVVEIKSFVALNFNDNKCFIWQPVSISASKQINQMPMYAVRLGFDVVTQSALYAGRSIASKNFELIGQIYSSSNLYLTVPYKNEAISFSRYEILCLKPSPLALKKLCYNRIRKLMMYENKNIERLEFLIESSLLHNIKFSNILKCGAQLRPGESIISRNNKFKLSLETNRKLLFYINENRDFLFLYDEVESLWFSEMGLVVCFTDFRTKTFIQSFDSLGQVFKDFKLKLLNNGNLNLESEFNPTTIVIQLRDDLASFINSNIPKFDFVYYFEKNPKYKEENVSSDDENDKSDDSNTDSKDSDSSQYSSSDSSPDISKQY